MHQNVQFQCIFNNISQKVLNSTDVIQKRSKNVAFFRRLVKMGKMVYKILKLMFRGCFRLDEKNYALSMQNQHVFH